MKINGKLWIDINGLGTASHGRIRLLELVGETGSIKKAAESLGMSYKAAWDTINTLNTIYGKNLVERKTGGRGGGGTVLTEHGHDLIKTYNHYSTIHELYLTDITQMNCVEAVVQEVAEGYTTAVTATGDVLTCVLLDKGIQAGNKVNLFIKPSDIILIKGEGFETSARNLLKAKVRSVTVKDGKSEIILTSEKGTVISTKITETSADKLNIEKNTEITALFKTASVLATRI